MIGNLRPGDFTGFFQALHGLKPFPWQERLADQVSMHRWPAALDIPTGAGKTAVIDIAVFHLALEAARGPERRAAVRVLFVVDRRLIVDDAYHRAQTIAEKLANARDGILKRVADRLRLLAEDVDMPLRVARLRGGMPKEPDWVRTPAQPTVVVSTVDQVGSRFLFRGYGVSDSMKPIHAGLLGSDALLILDEAHLSQPFVQTARDTKIFRTDSLAESVAPAPFEVITLSATYADNPQEDGEEPFRITDEDRADNELGKRLQASKPAELIETKASDAPLANEFADKALELANQLTGGCVVAVVVNRVKRAREIFEILLKKGAHAFAGAESQEDQGPSLEVALLIGRTRDLDRSKLTDKLLPFVQAGSGRKPRTAPLIIVATQCIEAGADLDFDALVTEIAPLDCLRQRFGRVNRMGRPLEVRATVLASTDQIKKSAPADPIYGDALRSTWTLLLEKSRAQGRVKAVRHIVDFGIEQSAIWVPKGKALKEYIAPRKNAPVLLPNAIQFWSRTSPISDIDPEVALYLHGPETGAGDVEIVWRADLDDTLDEKEKENLWKERAWVCPPSSLEAISVPLVEARRWLHGQSNAEIADVEADPGDPNRASSPPSRHVALRWRGKDDAETGLIEADDLRASDTVVVPASRGACDRWGWAPNLEYPVQDLGREANRLQRGRDIFRLTNATPELSQEDIASPSQMLDWADKEVVNHFGKYFDTGDEPGLSIPRVVRSSDGKPLAIERKLILAREKPQGDSIGDAVTEDNESVSGIRQRSVLLSAHSKGVQEYARRFAQRAGLPSEIVEDLALAGYLHDAGKAHPEFKRLLYGGDELGAIGAPDLAKSAKLPASPAAWREARRRANLPESARHEVASLQFAEAHPAFASAKNPDLVLWLIGTHHGYGRPFFPTAEREWPREGDTFESDLGDGRIAARPARSLADLTAVWIDLSDELMRRYGAWGLARLEAILRLADHRSSEAEQD